MCNSYNNYLNDHINILSITHHITLYHTSNHSKTTYAHIAYIYVLNRNILNIQFMIHAKPRARANIQHTIYITYDGRATYLVGLSRRTP